MYTLKKIIDLSKEKNYNFNKKFENKTKDKGEIRKNMKKDNFNLFSFVLIVLLSFFFGVDKNKKVNPREI